MTTEEVRAAISDGGPNGITLEVGEDARRALAEYEPKIGDAIRIRPTIAGTTEIDRIKGVIIAVSEDGAMFSFEGLNELGAEVWGADVKVCDLGYSEGAWSLERTVSVQTTSG